MKGSSTNPLKAVREKCLDCATTSRAVKYCTCDGRHSTWCALWPMRFGRRPSTMLRGPDADLVNPEKMPHEDVALEGLPTMRRRVRFERTGAR